MAETETPQITQMVKAEPKQVGRPTVMTKEIIDKLETGFMYSFTDREACLYAGIAVDTLYKYQRENPEFIKRKEELKLSPNLKAKKVLVEGIDNDIGQARWWAERKIRDEFQPSAKMEHTGNVVMTDVPSVIGKEEEELAKRYEDDLDKLLAKTVQEPETKVEVLQEPQKRDEQLHT